MKPTTTPRKTAPTKAAVTRKPKAAPVKVTQMTAAELPVAVHTDESVAEAALEKSLNLPAGFIAARRAQMTAELTPAPAVPWEVPASAKIPTQVTPAPARRGRKPAAVPVDHRTDHSSWGQMAGIAELLGRDVIVGVWNQCMPEYPITHPVNGAQGNIAEVLPGSFADAIGKALADGHVYEYKLIQAEESA